MSIDAVLEQLIVMMRDAGVPIPDVDLAATSSSVTLEDPNPTLVYEAFKKFAYMPFDCSFDNDDEYKCIEWEDECILFECYSDSSVFEFEFRRAFSIRFTHEGRDTLYSDLITCTLQYESNDELSAVKITEFIFPPYDESSSLDKFFAKIEALDIYRVVMNKYHPKLLFLFESD